MSTLHCEAGVKQSPIEGWETGSRELDRRIAAAVARKDVDGVMSCFLDSPDLVVLMWGYEMHGAKQVRAAVEKLFKDYDSVELRVDREEHIPSGDAVIAIGQVTYRLTKSIEVKTVTELFSQVRRNVNGRWTAVLDHSEILRQ